MNKKFLLSILIAVILGISTAKVVYSKTNISKEDKNDIYFLQLGVYSSINSMEEDTKKVDNKLVLKEDNKYYVYVAISKYKDNLNKISKLYNNLGYNLYIKPRRVVNQEFLLNLEQFDKLLKTSTALEEINTINSVVLSSYEEMVINSEK